MGEVDTQREMAAMGSRCDQETQTASRLKQQLASSEARCVGLTEKWATQAEQLKVALADGDLLKSLASKTEYACQVARDQHREAQTKVAILTTQLELLHRDSDARIAELQGQLEAASTKQKKSREGTRREKANAAAECQAKCEELRVALRDRENELRKAQDDLRAVHEEVERKDREVEEVKKGVEEIHGHLAEAATREEAEKIRLEVEKRSLEASNRQLQTIVDAVGAEKRQEAADRGTAYELERRCHEVDMARLVAEKEALAAEVRSLTQRVTILGREEKENVAPADRMRAFWSMDTKKEAVQREHAAGKEALRQEQEAAQATNARLVGQCQVLAAECENWKAQSLSLQLASHAPLIATGGPGLGRSADGAGLSTPEQTMLQRQKDLLERRVRDLEDAQTRSEASISVLKGELGRRVEDRREAATHAGRLESLRQEQSQLVAFLGSLLDRVEELVQSTEEGWRLLEQASPLPPVTGDLPSLQLRFSHSLVVLSATLQAKCGAPRRPCHAAPATSGAAAQGGHLGLSQSQSKSQSQSQSRSPCLTICNRVEHHPFAFTSLARPYPLISPSSLYP